MMVDVGLNDQVCVRFLPGLPPAGRGSEWGLPTVPSRCHPGRGALRLHTLPAGGHPAGWFRLGPRAPTVWGHSPEDPQSSGSEHRAGGGTRVPETGRVLVGSSWGKPDRQVMTRLIFATVWTQVSQTSPCGSHSVTSPSSF